MVEEEKTAEQLMDEARTLLAEGRKLQQENLERENLLSKREADLDDRDLLLNTKETSQEEIKIKLENEADQLNEAKKTFALEKSKVTLETKRVDSIKRFLGGEEPRSVARDDKDLLEQAIGTSKKDRANLKSKDFKGYEKLKEKAQVGLPKRFTLLEHIDLEDKKLDQLKNITTVVESIEDLKRKLEESDLTDVFSIPSDFEEKVDSSYEVEWMPTHEAVEINLFEDYDKVDLDTVKKATAWYNRRGKQYHVENIKWSGEAILNSCTSELKSKMTEEMRYLKESEKGGPTYLVMMIKKIISTSDTAIRGLTKKIETMKLSDYDGENVLHCATFIKNAIKLMKDHSSVPKDITTLVLDIFSYSTCDKFNTLVSSIQSQLELKERDYTVERILKILESSYSDKLGSGQWTSKTSTKVENSTFNVSTTSKDDIMCLNCGQFGHMVKECPQAIDENAIAKRKKIVFKTKGDSNSDDNSNNKRRSQRQKNRNNNDNKDPKKQPPKKDEAHEKDFNGQKLKWCGKCGKWTNHSTAEHKPKKKEKQDDKDDDKEENANAVFIGGATALDAINFS